MVPGRIILFFFFVWICLATDFTLKPSDCPDSEFPVRIADSDRGCLWYKKDNKFKIPKGEICVSRVRASVCVCIIQQPRWFHKGIFSTIREVLTLACPLRLSAAYIRFHIISPVIQQSAKKWVQVQMWPCANSVLFVFLAARLISISFFQTASLSSSSLHNSLHLFYGFNPPLFYFAITTVLPCFHLLLYLAFISPLALLSTTPVSLLPPQLLSFPCDSSTPLLPCFVSPSSSVVLFDLLVNILGHNLAEPAYEAEVAQLEYKLVAGEHGLVIKVKGFNHKLPVSEHAWGTQSAPNN